MEFLTTISVNAARFILDKVIDLSKLISKSTIDIYN